MMRTVLSLFICIAFLFGIASASAEAIDPPSYAVLSLIGDNLSLVVYNGTTGSNLSSTRKELVQISTPVFDDSALRGVAEAIAQFQSNATEKLISTNAPALYKLQNDIFASSSDGEAARETIMAVLKGAPVFRVIVIPNTKAMRIGDQVNTNSEPTLNLRNELHAWNVLSDEQKAASLQKIVRVATHDAALNLLKATSVAN